MKIELEFVQLHTGDPLFFKGINFGEKLYKDTRKNKLNSKPLTLEYDTDLGVVFVTSDGKQTIIPSFASATVYSTDVVKEAPYVSHPQQSGVAVKAQVGGPNEVRAQVKLSAQVEFQGGENQGE
jgi:hypothetical protein